MRPLQQMGMRGAGLPKSALDGRAIHDSRDDPSPFVDVKLHQAFLSHFQQKGLASFLIHDIGALHDLVDFQRLLAKRAKNVFSIIQHDQTPIPSALD
jgi:hypothetical protein